MHEINNYLNAFVKLSQFEQTRNNSDPSSEKAAQEPLNVDESQTLNESKRIYLLNQIQALLNDLTHSSSTTLSQMSSTQTKSANSSSSDLSSNKINYANYDGLGKLNENQINPKSIADFRSQTFLCSECYGDLFIV